MLKKRKEFYNNHLVEVILKYWLPKIDEESGGFYTCYNVEGDMLVSKNKYTWSQGRCTWMYAKLAMSKSVTLDYNMRKQCRELAGMGAKFLESNCILPSGECAFCLNEHNQPIETIPGKGFAISSFADCFVIMGLAAYSVLEQNQDSVLKAFGLYGRLQEQVKSNTFATAPNILPAGWRSHSIPMIMLNTGCELRDALEKLGYEKEATEVDIACKIYMEDIYNNFMDNGIVHECLNANNSLLETLYGRHINPGHTNECMWFLIQAARKFNNEEIVKAAMNTVLTTSIKAWDEKNGGMMYYLDRDGGKPKGLESHEERFLADAALRDWDNKMWWPHTETIYANLLCYYITKDEDFLDQYDKYHDYTFSTFPNPDTSVGEWIQIRDRKGNPVLGTVGGRLPVKDPYHITRNLILLIEMLDSKE